MPRGGCQPHDIRRIRWTPAMLDKLIEMRQRGVAYRPCAEAIGVHEETIQKKCQQLRLNGRMNRGNLRGEELHNGK